MKTFLSIAGVILGVLLLLFALACVLVVLLVLFERWGLIEIEVEEVNHDDE